MGGVAEVGLGGATININDPNNKFSGKIFFILT